MSDQPSNASRDTARPVETANFPCEGCGSQMVFDPDTQQLKCIHCGALSPLSSQLLEAPEYRYDPAADTHTAPDWETLGSQAVRCAGCGATTLIPADEMTAACPFCGSYYVVEQDAVTVGILPETLIPFRISRQKALALFAQWARKRFWAPKAFKKGRHAAEKLTGQYLPYWTFDAGLSTDYAGQGGKDYTVTRTRRVNGKTQTYTVTQTRWYPVSGIRRMDFDDTPVCGTRLLDTGLIEGLGAYSTKMLSRYSPAFLAGFSATRYDVSLSDAWKAASDTMQNRMQNTVESELGYDHYRNMSYDHLFTGIRFKHILLPVWISAYSYKNKLYHFLVNGETGHVTGKAPVSALKVVLTLLAVSAAVGGIALAAYLFSLR
ncbi:MAG: hypothetical protein HFJ79_06535 [Clostridiales bacterium]|nr:hypothetical protein [Clostridiales bacterium]